MLAISGTVQPAIAMLTTAVPRVSWNVSVAMFLAPYSIATAFAAAKDVLKPSAVQGFP